MKEEYTLKKLFEMMQEDTANSHYLPSAYLDKIKNLIENVHLFERERICGEIEKRKMTFDTEEFELMEKSFGALAALQEKTIIERINRPLDDLLKIIKKL